MNVYEYLLQKIKKQGAAYLVLIDPDKIKGKKLSKFVSTCCKSGVDALLFGGSLVIDGALEARLETIKKSTTVPIIIFPGSVNQITPNADAILFLSLISGRNAEHLIGKHVVAAPFLKRLALEPIATGYILVESGKRTTAEYMSGSQPIPRNKPEIAAATALAGQYLGMKLIYLEAGSGAELSVPVEMVKTVSGYLDVPLIVGGGIRSPEQVSDLVQAGAKIIVTGNFFENESEWGNIRKFAKAAHFKGNKV
jgi:putative glycerol-1-phosphate prenyltransferase